MLKLFLVLVVACATAEWFWWIAGIALLNAVVLVCTRKLGRAAAGKHAIADRADQQHAWTLAGDDRGTYGIFTPADPYPDERDAPVPNGFAKRARIAPRPSSKLALARRRGVLAESVMNSDRVQVMVRSEVDRVYARAERYHSDIGPITVHVVVD